jgi:predicted metalloprotease
MLKGINGASIRNAFECHVRRVRETRATGKCIFAVSSYLGTISMEPYRVPLRFYESEKKRMRFSGLQIEAYFTHLKRQKRIGDDVGNFKYVFTKQKK